MTIKRIEKMLKRLKEVKLTGKMEIEFISGEVTSFKVYTKGEVNERANG